MEAVALIIAMIYHLTNLIDALTTSDSKSTINYTEIKLFLGMGEKKNPERCYAESENVHSGRCAETFQHQRQNSFCCPRVRDRDQYVQRWKRVKL